MNSTSSDWQPCDRRERGGTLDTPANQRHRGR
jgi:hypothetical protein